MAVLAMSSRQTLLTMAGLALAGITMALIAQYGFDMRPCPWCILQRLTFVAIALLCLLGAALPLRRLAAGLAIVLALLGSSAALYQHFVAAKSASCNLTLADKIIDGLRLEALLPSLFQITGSCADAAVSVLGVPFEFWSLGLFVVLLIVAVPVLFGRR
ncbi:MAG TPA: disulfide bond formation protein B [Albitalea sp.]|nr:disulfide bond formation protein B [Albitalea sp.]